jgi:hypothetical protein
MERALMTMSSQIAYDSPAARRLRLLAPLGVLLGLALLVMVPGFIAGLGHDDDVRPPQMVNQLAPDAPEG